MVSRIGAVIAALTITAGNLVSSQAVQADPAPLLPDLRQAPVGCPGGFSGSPLTCRAWDVCMVRDSAQPRGGCVHSGGPISSVRLRFTTSIDNIGDGPLLLHARRSSVNEPTMKVRQAIQSGVDGSVPRSFDEAQRDTPAGAYDAFIGPAAAQAAQRRPWTPADGPLPALYLSHGAPPLASASVMVRLRGLRIPTAALLPL